MSAEPFATEADKPAVVATDRGNSAETVSGAVVAVPPAQAAMQDVSFNPDVVAVRWAARFIDWLVSLPFAVFFLIPIVGPMLYTLGFIGYLVACEALFGQTLGKKVFNLKVETLEGKRLGFGKALVRNSFILLGFLPYIGSVLSLVAGVVIGTMIGTTRDRRGPHDRLVGARVVRPVAR